MATQQLASLAESTGVKFGTSGVRGLVAAMTDRVCYAYTAAFLSAIAGDADTIVIGHDLRPSSPAITAACIAAIQAAGKKALYAGTLPTPALAFYGLTLHAPAIIITGSHIPFDRNGIKFYGATGEISKDDEAAMLRADIDLPDTIHTSPLPAPDTRPYQEYVARYVDFFGPGALKGTQVLLYQHSSAARDVLQDILVQMGCDVLALGRTDGFVPIDTEAVRPEDILLAREWARTHRFDAIFSTDGDADRPLLGDEKGQWLRGDVVGVLCARYLDADSVVAPVSCNTALEKSQYFTQVVRTKIGSPYVIEGMEKAPDGSRVAGYEANGGFLLGHDVQRGDRVLRALPTRDATLPMIALLCMARDQGMALSDLVKQLPPRFTHSDRLQDVPTCTSAQLLAGIVQDETRLRTVVPLKDAIDRIDQTDGVRIHFANGDIVHFRPSGNAPELRCYTEADDPVRAKQLCDESLALIRAAI